MSAKRRAILKAMTCTGPLALREIARRVWRDVKAVHADVHALLNAGLIQHCVDGFLFPYDDVHVDFMVKVAWVEREVVIYPG